jgi:hypothetical protein
MVVVVGAAAAAAAATTTTTTTTTTSQRFGTSVGPFLVQQPLKTLRPNSRSTPTLISGLRCDVDEICYLLGYDAASCGNCLPTFRDDVSVPSSTVKVQGS